MVTKKTNSKTARFGFLCAVIAHVVFVCRAQQQREGKKNRPKEVKAQEKQEKARLKSIYGIAMVDGHPQGDHHPPPSSLGSCRVRDSTTRSNTGVGNYVVEPPGLFLGRG